MTKRIKLCALITAVAVSGAMTSCKEKEQQQQQQQEPQVQVMTVTSGQSDLQSSYPATLRGKTDIEIRPQISSTISGVHVDEGQHVKKGQLLFTLDPVPLQAAVDQAQAAVNSAQAALNSAQATERNTKMLYDKNIVAKSAWDTSVDALNQARAGLAQAKASLAAAQKNLSYTRILAPSDGVVGTIPQREGSLATPSSPTPLTTVSDISKVYAYFSLTEKELLDMSEGGKYSTTESLGKMPMVKLQLANGQMYPLEGQVATVSGIIDPTTGAASVRALFDNPAGMLRSGSTGQIIIPRKNEDVIIIPQKATFELQDKTFAFVVGKDNVLQSRPIEILDINDGQNYVVLSGLQPGEQIVVEGVGTQAVQDKMKVKPAGAQAPQTAAQK